MPRRKMPSGGSNATLKKKEAESGSGSGSGEDFPLPGRQAAHRLGGRPQLFGPVEPVAYCYAEGGVAFMMTPRLERFVIGATPEELETTLNPRLFFARTGSIW